MIDWAMLTPEQRRAAGTLDRNVSLMAGAGTGKTTALTARYMELFRRQARAAGVGVADGDVPTLDPADPPLGPTNVLATTFTERAANELREAVRAELAAEMAASEDPAAYRYWRTLADELADGYIHTLHGFCARLLREHALEASGVDPGFETLDEEESAALQRRVVERLLEDRDDTAHVARLAGRYRRGRLADILTDLLGERPESVRWARRWRDADRAAYLEHVWSDLHPISPGVARETVRGEPGAALRTLGRTVAAAPDVDSGDGMWELAVAVVERAREAGIDLAADSEGEPAAGLDPAVEDRPLQAFVNDVCDILTTASGDRYSGRYYEGTDTNWAGHEGRQAAVAEALGTLLEHLTPTERHVDADPAVDAAAFPAVQALAELFAEVAEAYATEKRRRNVLDYTDQVGAARTFLLEDADEATRATLRDRFAAVLVDELQDTDPRQWAIVRALTTHAPDPETFDAQSVFVVGDTKQSIYRFRNADVTMFDTVAGELAAANPDSGSDRPGSGSEGGDEDEGEDADGAAHLPAAVAGAHRGGEPAGAAGETRLTRSFRTLPNVLGVVNELFERVFTADGTAPFEAEPQALTPDRGNPADIDATVEHLCVPADATLLEALYEDGPPIDPETAVSSTALEAEALAARLTRVLAGGRPVYDPEEPAEDDGTSEPRAIEPGDIAVLLRSRTHLKTYERALDDADIPYTVASGLGFYETPEIEALVNLLRVLVDPHDERALYAVLRSPLFGLTDDTIARLRLETPDAPGADRDREPTLWDGLLATDRDPLVEARQLLRRWREAAGTAGGQRTTDSWAALLTDVIGATGYLVSVGAGERPDQAVANVEKLRAQVRAWDAEGIASLPVLLDRLEERVAESEREGEADTTAAEDGVQIMTVHDAKGDEFPMVVVPGLDRRFMDRAAVGDGAIEFETVDGVPAAGLKGPDPEDPMETAGTVAREGIRRRRRREERAEEKRTLYVACTRARDHLLLSGVHDLAGDADPETEGLSALASPDPEGASRWLDWVGATLLPEGVREALTAAEDQRVTARLDAVGARPVDADPAADADADGGLYHVRLPEAPVAVTDDASTGEPTVTVPAPPTGTDRPRYGLSPSSLGTLFDGEGEIVHDEHTDRLSLQEPTGDDPVTADGTEPSTHAKGLPANLFGDVVHKLAERRPPEDRWQEIALGYVAAREGVDAGMLDMAVLRDHARTAVGFVEALAADPAVEGLHHERYVTAELEHGEVGGFIDLLAVTPDRFHVVDYKTSSLDGTDPATKAGEYRPQLRAYAAALGQLDPDRDVHTTVLFTETGATESHDHAAADLPALAADLEAQIEARLRQDAPGWVDLSPEGRQG